MTQDTLTGDPHIADGDILRFHDDECNSVERDRIARHLAECPTCVESSKFFQAVSKQLDASLDEIEVQPIEGAKQRFLTARARVTHSAPQLGKHRRVQLLRAAAVILAVVGAGMWAPPVRAWFFELLTPARPNTVEITSAPVEAEPLPTSSTISFVPSSSAFVIEIATTPVSGSLVIAVGEGDAASTRVTGRAAGESVFVTGDGIEIRNSAASTATYGVTVPSTVRRITVILGGSEIASYTASVIAGRDSVVIQLAR